MYLQCFTLNAVAWMVAVMLLGRRPSQAHHIIILNVGQFAHLRDINSLRQPFLFTRQLALTRNVSSHYGQLKYKTTYSQSKIGS
jgi:hypothetical protein